MKLAKLKKPLNFLDHAGNLTEVSVGGIVQCLGPDYRGRYVLYAPGGLVTQVPGPERAGNTVWADGFNPYVELLE